MNWHYDDNGTHEGPYSESEMQEFIAAGVIRSDILIWGGGYQDWFPAMHQFRFDADETAPPAVEPVVTVAPPLPTAVKPPPLTDASYGRAASAPRAVTEGLGEAELALVKELQAGGRYVFYSYTISIVILTFNRSSDVMFVPSGKSRVLTGLPYTLVSFLFGWWGFPFGIVFTPIALVKNLSGGTDVTAKLIGEDRMAKLQIEPDNNGLRVFLAILVVMGSMLGLFYGFIFMFSSSGA